MTVDRAHCPASPLMRRTLSALVLLLIDAWVQSGSDTEHRASLFLLGGRPYPLRLEFSKAKQGVDDSDKNKPKDVKASISLEWQLPRRAAEVIPQRDLSPNPVPEVFLAMTAFPPDDRSLGWERGMSVSRAWDQSATDAAIEAAGYVAAHLSELAGVRDDAPDRGQRLRAFCRQFAERAFRRPLTEDQSRSFVERQFERAGEPERAVKRVVLLVLSSPRFLYPEVAGAADGYSVASRLSFGLWDSLPDAELLQAAAAGKLATREQVAGHAVPALEPGVKAENDNMPRLSKMQIELLVNSFAADFARVATFQFTNSVGQARMRWLKIDDGHHELSHKPDEDKASQDKLTRINAWYCEQLVYLAKR